MAKRTTTPKPPTVSPVATAGAGFRANAGSQELAAWAYGQRDHGPLPPRGHEDWAQQAPRSNDFAEANQHYEQAHMQGHAPAQAPDYVAPKKGGK
jgi:hypothetical protein